MKKQTVDSVIEEIHETRRDIAKRFNCDIQLISDDARRRQALEGKPLWPPKSADTPIHSNGGGTIPDNGAFPPDVG